MSEEYIRTELLIGSEGMGRLRESSVLVFGVGGVGSHCIEALARSGVGHLILVDNDVVSLSNINRQSIALHSTVGRYKTEVMKEKIRDIDPGIRVDTHETFILSDNVEDVITGTEDYIIDAVDTVTAKLSIIQTALEKEIPVISSMGTGNKLHPEMFEITDISQTSVCPLCRVMRRELKARGISQLKVLFSKEKPVDTSGRTTGEDPGARRSIPGSIAFVPPVAGLMIAGEVIRELAGIR
ncbi:tRNA threonylcarbamoyladenosine dehydratase [Mediterraneibacter glycyrrhizinilyticus]|nr:tRNA threonylcarbamoyladenosine dehydratase [Mediterraneibacter glycyrrhizinilyticus]MBM6852973.1 tRNA threonylcarbamoyladenosine dehydratase [Mediterraneibacter glycyrrhizinilyticus]